MSLDVVQKLIRCDGERCHATTRVPITLRQYYDDARLELRNESSAAGWVFLSTPRHDRHYCPVCGEKYIGPTIDASIAT